MVMKREKSIQVFWRRVNVGLVDECWEWLGSKVYNNYGTKRWNGVATLVHRISWIIHYGPIPEGMCVCHKCGNPPCVNPKHLFLGTSRENTKDKIRKGRQAKGETHGMSKLTETDVKRIRELYSTGNYTKAHLGRMYGISKTQACDIVRFKSWKHLK